jgi:putative membrane protein
MRFLLRILVSAIAVYFVANFLSGVKLDDYTSAFLVAAALAFLNAIVKPVLTILTIPITVVTLGLFLVVINAVLILAAERLVPGFHVNGFLTAILFSICLSIMTGILNFLFGVNDQKKREE